MWRLLFLSTISAALAAGCSDDCGPGSSFEYGLTVSNDQVHLVYGDLTAGANNDCPDPAAPASVISLTIGGVQMPGSGSGLVTLCIPRPDQLATTALPLGSGAKLVDVTGDDGTCTYTNDATQLPTGTIAGHGMCNNGTNKAGFALVFDGFIGLRRTCGTTVDTVHVGITGNVTVTAM